MRDEILGELCKVLDALHSNKKDSEIGVESASFSWVVFTYIPRRSLAKSGYAPCVATIWVLCKLSRCLAMRDALHSFCEMIAYVSDLFP